MRSVEPLRLDYAKPKFSNNEGLILDGFSPLIISVAALRKLRKHQIPIAEELLASYELQLDESLEPQEQAEQPDSNVISMDDFRQTHKTEPPAGEPDPLDDLGIEQSASNDEPIESELNINEELLEETEEFHVGGTELATEEELALDNEVETDVLESSAIEEIIEDSYTTFDALENLAAQLSQSHQPITAEELAEYLLTQNVEIEGYEPEGTDEESLLPAIEAQRPKRKVYTGEDSFSQDPLEQLFRQLRQYPLLNKEQEIMLAKRIERGDHSAKERMINSNMRLVVSIAKRYRGHGVPFMDLIQSATIGLNRAVEKFDWRMDYKFSTYATWWIRQACQRAVHNDSRNIRVPVHVAERQAKIRKVSGEFLVTEGREPTVDELVSLTKLKRHHIEETLDVAKTISLNAAVGSDEDGELGDLVADITSEDPFEEAAISYRDKRVREVLDYLSPQERKILELRFGFNDMDPHTLEQIGSEIGLTRERVRQIERKALERFRFYIGDIEE